MSRHKYVNFTIAVLQCSVPRARNMNYRCSAGFNENLCGAIPGLRVVRQLGVTLKKPLLLLRAFDRNSGGICASTWPREAR
jgi:hypothetical protein